ncbi:MAG: hypothetical protein RLZZ330_1284, partial [Actinomycetota bacterium]
MKILVIGGTRFVGLAMVRELLNRGHEVSVFHRTNSIPAGTEKAHHLIGDRTKDFTALQTGSWDAVIDVCGYRPYEIHALYDALAGRIQKYVFISTVSVYDESIPTGENESAKLADTSVLDEADEITIPIDWETYGPLKVLCEQAVKEHYPNNLIIRPTYVIGPDDYTNRFNFWVEKFVNNETVEVPLNNATSMQFIDVRDLAAFTCDAIEKNLKGEFHICAPTTTFINMISHIKATTNSKSEI